jgi:hypothetical protein
MNTAHISAYISGNLMLMSLVNVMNKLTNTETQFTHYIVISGFLKVTCVL